jgi:23S rRNA (uracil1939-C5)-methyltransferase
MDRKFKKFSKKNYKPKQEEVKKLPVEIESLVWGGKGLARVEGKVFFVTKSAPADKLLIKVTKEKSDYGEGEIDKILLPSPFRISPICPHFNKCGGCQYLHLNYPKQLEEKERIAKEILRRWSSSSIFHPIVASPNPIEYRHSGDFHIFLDRDRLKVGFYEPESHKIVPFDRCFLFPENFNDTLSGIKDTLQKSSWKEKLFKISLSMADNLNDFALTVSLKEKNEQAGQAVMNELNHLNLKGILVLGTRENEIVCREGDTSLSYSIASQKNLYNGEIKLKYDSRSFTQADYAMNGTIVDDVLSMMNLSRHEKVLELYSGIGNFTLPLAKNCKEVAAVESSKFAVADSKENAVSANCTNITHLEGGVEDWIIKLLGKSSKFDDILLDPPRSGAFEVISHLSAFSPKKVVYVSCSLPTLDRDLRRLSEFGFKPKEFRFYDLFPQTYGIETAVLLEGNE